MDLLVLIAVGRFCGRVGAFRAWRWRITCWSMILLDRLELKDTKVNSTECVWVLVSSGMRWEMDLYNSFGWGEVYIIHTHEENGLWGSKMI